MSSWNHDYSLVQYTVKFGYDKPVTEILTVLKIQQNETQKQ